MPISPSDSNISRREHYSGLLDSVIEFMSTAGQTTSKLNAEQACFYTGLQLEELAEKIEAISTGCVEPLSKAKLHGMAIIMHDWAKDFKEKRHTGDVLRSTHKDLIDADIDLAWVSLGSLLSTSPQPYRAIAHCTFTNLDKFRGGKCIKDANGKVQKPADWQPADFSPYTDQTDRA